MFCPYTASSVAVFRQGCQIDVALSYAKGVRRGRGVRISCDLPADFNGVSTAAGAAKSTKIRHDARAVKKRMR